MRGSLTGAVLLAAALSSGAQPVPVPVVLELFTSEGCSSCPPADAVLSKLSKEQPVSGVQVIPLGMHVTYWDQLGWKDPASLQQATDRQQDYGRIVFGEDRVYTPQAVVDGREEVIGSSEPGVRQAILKAAKQPHVRVSITPDLHAEVSGPPADARERLEVVWMVVEDGLTTIVKRGENGGRTLHHDAVVRYIGKDTIPQAWRRPGLRAVALVQGQKSRRIWGAAQAVIK
jgi:hypothetical protein